MSAWNEDAVEISAEVKVQHLRNAVSGCRFYRVRVQRAGVDADWTSFDPTPDLDALFAHAEKTGEVYPLLDKLADTDLTPVVQAAIGDHLKAR